MLFSTAPEIEVLVHVAMVSRHGIKLNKCIVCYWWLPYLKATLPRGLRIIQLMHGWVGSYQWLVSNIK